MSRSFRLMRGVASAIALIAFLGASWSEARALDPCPHHDAIAMDMAGMSGMAGMPGMTGVMAGHEGQNDPSGHPEHHGPCKCMGCCAAGSPPAITPVVSVALSVPLARVSSPVASPGTRSAHRSTDVWARYPPTAPPDLVRDLG